MPYVSITGLRLKAPYHAVRFWYHALRSMAQAQQAPGCRSVDARQIDGVNHTLSMWDDQAAMRRFLVSGPHLAAMKAFRSIATGRTYGYETSILPGWDEARALLLANAREH